MTIPAITICSAALALVTLAMGSSPASAQAAPGASTEMSLMSTDLQAARTSALNMKAQAEQIRQQKLLSAMQAQTALQSTQTFDAATPTEVVATIPHGGGLVTGQARKVVISEFLADEANIETADPK